MIEEWKEIKLHGLNYRVSNHGKFVGARGELKQRLNRDGYLEVTVGTGVKRTTVRVHRIVAQLFLPNPNNLSEVNHLDYNRANPRVDNLEWSSHQDNILYSSKAGNYKNRYEGTKNNKAILNEEDVIDIRMLFDNGIMTQKELAEAYGVGWSTIHNICFRLTWLHII